MMFLFHTGVMYRGGYETMVCTHAVYRFASWWLDDFETLLDIWHSLEIAYTITLISNPG